MARQIAPKRAALIELCVADAIVWFQTQVSEYFNHLWTFFQPMLFGLIGTEIRVSSPFLSLISWAPRPGGGPG